MTDHRAAAHLRELQQMQHQVLGLHPAAKAHCALLGLHALVDVGQVVREALDRGLVVQGDIRAHLAFHEGGRHAGHVGVRIAPVGRDKAARVGFRVPRARCGALRPVPERCRVPMCSGRRMTAHAPSRCCRRRLRAALTLANRATSMGRTSPTRSFACPGPLPGRPHDRDQVGPRAAPTESGTAPRVPPN